MDAIDEKAHSLRDEIGALFGIRWDNLVEWMVIIWLSAWLWTSWLVSNSVVFPSSGPLTWLVDLGRRFQTDAPGWLTDTTRNLTHGPSWVTPLLVIASALAITYSVRSHQYSGLRALALALLAAATERDGSAWPLLWVMLIALIPMGAAFVAAILSARGDPGGDSFFWPGGVAKRAIYGASVIALPVIAPFWIVVGAVLSYRTVLPFRPAARLMVEAVRELEDAREGGRDGALGELGVLAAMLASGRRDAETREATAALTSALEQPIGARRIDRWR